MLPDISKELLSRANEFKQNESMIIPFPVTIAASANLIHAFYTNNFKINDININIFSAIRFEVLKKQL